MGPRLQRKRPHDPFKRFWFYVEKQRGRDACWIWTGQRRNGYGRFVIAGKFVTASRFSYEQAIAPLRPDQDVLHRCDNPPCVRPLHLFVGTQQINVTDCVTKGRHKNQTYHGEANAGARLTLASVTAIRQLAADGVPKLVLEQRFSVSRRNLNRILQGERWRGPNESWLKRTR